MPQVNVVPKGLHIYCPAISGWTGIYAGLQYAGWPIQTHLHKSSPAEKGWANGWKKQIPPSIQMGRDMLPTTLFGLAH